MYRFTVLILAVLWSSAALGQAWQVPLNTIPYGKGPGQASFGSVANTGSGTLCLLNTTPPSFGTCSGSLPTLNSGRLFVGNGSNVATSVPLSGDCTLVASGAITCLKTNGSNFGTMALQSAAAVAVTGGALASVTLTGSAFNGTIGATTPSTGVFTNATVGTGSGTPTILVNGASSGSGTGNQIVGQEGGSNIWALGSYSAVLGGTHDSTPVLGSSGSIIFAPGNSTKLSLSSTGAINQTISGSSSTVANQVVESSLASGNDVSLVIGQSGASNLSAIFNYHHDNTLASRYVSMGFLAAGNSIRIDGSGNVSMGQAGGNFGVGTTTPDFLGSAGQYAAVSGESGGANNPARIGVGGNITGTTNFAGSFNVYNSAIVAADKRIVNLSGSTDGATNSGKWSFNTFNAGTPTTWTTLDHLGVLSHTGSFGIGTSSPATQLHTTGTVRFAGISGVGTSGCLGNDTSGNITGGNPCSGTGFPSGGVKGDIPYYSAANTGAATPASDANIVIQGGDPSGAGSSTTAAALAYAYSKRVVLPPAPGGTTGTYKFSTDVTFPSGTELIIPCGVTLAPDSGKFVRNLGVTKAGYCTIVSGAGVVSLGRDVKADWWPSTGGDDTIAINAADKSTNNASALSFTGSISTTTLTVTAVASGYITLGKPITGAGVTANTIVTALGTGTGEVGTYTVSISQTVGSEAMTGDSADGSENIIRLSCRTYTIATAIILHANLANPQKLTGCGPKTTTLSASGGSFSRGALTQAGTTAGVGNDLMQFTWRDFGIACSADQNIQGITLGTTTKAIRSYGKNVIERVGVFDCRVGIGWYNTRLVDLIDMWINVHGETTAAATAIQMDFDDNSQFNGDSDIIRGQFACNLTSPSGGAGYGLRLKSEHSGGNIAGIRVHGSVFYYCNKMVYGTWASTGTMGDHWFTDGIQCETCGNLADYSGSTGSKKAAMLRFDNIYLTGTAGQPLFRFAGGNADEIVDILVHNIRARGGGGCSTCRFASFEYASNATVTGNQIISFEGTGGNPNELINLTAARKAMIANNIGDPDGIGGSVPFLVTAGTSSIDVSVVNNTARQAVTATWNASSVTNVCVANNLPTAASGC